MVKSLIKLTDYEDMVVKIVKAKYGFKNKNEAIRYIISKYESEFLEPGLKPEFIDKMEMRTREPVVKVKDIEKHLGSEEDA